MNGKDLEDIKNVRRFSMKFLSRWQLNMINQDTARDTPPHRTSQILFDKKSQAQDFVTRTLPSEGFIQLITLMTSEQ